MQAPIRRFLGIKTAGVHADRRPWTVCGGRFSILGFPNPGYGPIAAQSRTVVTHHERGEVDGAKEVDGG